MKNLPTLLAATPLRKVARTTLAAATIATTALTTGCIFERQTNTLDSLPVGAPMPEFSVSNPDGTIVTDADLRGHRTVVALFRTTCPDCSREMPNVEEAFRRTSTSTGTANNLDVRFVAISKEDNAAETVPAYWEATGMTMPWFLDPAGAAFESFGVAYVPTLYLFGTDGKVAYVAVETFDFSADELVTLIENLQ
ncbi:MAG: TlpA family protein disulfide reductase [Alistipes sp.]|jgi:peroxiredoxin|nr:TlpA family protein disulfide reductase [Alistipes sp.]